MKVKLFILICFLASLNSLSRAQDCPDGAGPQGEEHGGGGDEAPPEPPKGPEYRIPILVAIDPNDIIGPKGYGELQWISPGQLLDYTIRFENDPDFATAPAQVVKINHPLDSNININSLRLADFGFGDFTFKVPSNSSFYQGTLDVTDSLGVLVNVTAGIDVNRREAFWIFESLDSATGLPPEDALVGFLPVNDTTAVDIASGKIGKGEGFVNFTVQANKGLDRLDSISAQAFIIFDINAPLATNIWINHLDPLPPVSKITSLEDTGNQIYHIHTESEDEGSGLETYDLYYSVNGGPLLPLATDLRDQSLYVFDTGIKDSTYCFVTLARDFAGNLESFKPLGEHCINLSDSPLPEIISFSPPKGPTGTEVTLSGKYFTGTTSVLFNDKEAEFTLVNAETIHATVPAEAGDGPIKVVKENGTAISGVDFVYEVSVPVLNLPVLASFIPENGKAGTEVTVTGKHFTGSTAVSVNGKPAEFVIVNDETITLIIPVDAGSGLIEVTNADGTGSSEVEFVFEIPSPEKNPPALTEFAPNKGIPGTEVTLTGRYFTGVTSVTFGGTAATFTIVDDETITVIVPEDAEDGPIKIVNGDGEVSSTTDFKVEVPVPEKAPPVLIGFTPGQGGPGAEVTLSGNHFAGVTTVSFNGKPATFTIVDNNIIRATVPAEAGTGPIRITNPDGTVSSTTDFVFIDPIPEKTPPVLNSFAPNQGIAGTFVTLNGKYFTGVTEVTINGKPAVYTIVNDKTITVTVPDDAGTGPIRITNVDGTVISATDFVFEIPEPEKTPPILSSFTPDKGGEGAIVTLIGKYYTGVTSVTINGKPVEFEVVDDETIKVTIPKDLGTGPILITNLDGTVTSATDFVYDEITGIIVKPMEKIISLFPNPTTGLFSMTTTTGSLPNGMITIVDTQSKTIKTIDLGKVHSSELTVDISYVAAGVYFVYLENGREKWVQRLVKK
ncbi:IPT/TIG domain-containing protein [Lunatibacter salilacus]|uniref:IPT/TIG domain-containing protein n=1 Tax=Lunatibacter salilacus TaxID=2483804 RepID=UPI00131C888D|nr:IPT/TIG domain-containing protein [Lunatibacter salilacus]